MRVVGAGRGPRLAGPAAKALMAPLGDARGRYVGVLLLLTALWLASLSTAGTVQAAPTASVRPLNVTPGAVWGWGGDYFSQLGDGNSSPPISTSLVQTQIMTPAMAIAAGGDHSLALTADGGVLSWGDNRYGQLGLGQLSQYVPYVSTPQPVAGPSGSGLLTGITAIAAGGNHSGAHGSFPRQFDEDSLALRNDGTVWAWGADTFGQLGTGANAPATTCPGNGIAVPCSLVPLQVSNLSIVSAIAAGGDHNLALSGGQVWAWGDNDAGQLGLGTTGGSISTPQSVGGLSNVTAIAAGDAHSLALTASGQVWAWGDNNWGQLGNTTPNGVDTPTQVPFPAGVTIIAISAGANHNLALASDGSVWAWGDNTYHQLGRADVSQLPTPTQVAGVSGVTQIAAGDAHSVALAANGTVWAWGADNFEQLGTSAIASDPTACPPPIFSSTPTPCSATPLAISVPGGALMIASGANHVLAITPPPTLSITPSSVDFGGILYGSSAQQTITLVNNNSVPVTLNSSPTVVGLSFSGTTTCTAGLVMAPNGAGSCTVTVTFAPQCGPPYCSSFGGQVMIADGVPGGQSVTLSGTAVAPPTNTPGPTNTPSPTPTATATPTKTTAPGAPTATTPPSVPTATTPPGAPTATTPPGVPTATTAPGTAGGSTPTPTATDTGSGSGGIGVLIQDTPTPGTSSGQTTPPSGSTGKPTATPKPSKGGSHKPKLPKPCVPARNVPFALVLRLPSREVPGGRAYKVGVKTGGCARVDMTLQVTTTRMVTTGKGKKRKQVKQTVVLFKATTHGVADGHGQFNGALNVGYKPNAPAPAILSVSSHAGKKSKTYNAHVTIQPPPHPPALTTGVTPGAVAGGGKVTVSVRTAPNAQVVALLIVTQNKVIVTGTGKNRKRTTGPVVVYQANLQGTADAHGAYKGSLRVGYKPSKPVKATLLISATTPYGTANHTAHVTINPASK